MKIYSPKDLEQDFRQENVEALAYYISLRINENGGVIDIPRDQDLRYSNGDIEEVIRLYQQADWDISYDKIQDKLIFTPTFTPTP